MNVIRMEIYQLSNVPSEENDILTVQFSFKTEMKEKNSKTQHEICVKFAAQNWNLQVVKTVDIRKTRQVDKVLVCNHR